MPDFLSTKGRLWRGAGHSGEEMCRQGEQMPNALNCCRCSGWMDTERYHCRYLENGDTAHTLCCSSSIGMPITWAWA